MAKLDVANGGLATPPALDPPAPDVGAASSRDLGGRATAARSPPVEDASKEISAHLQRRRAAEGLSEVGVSIRAESLDVARPSKAQARHRAPPRRNILRECRNPGAHEKNSRTWCIPRTDQSVPEMDRLKAKIERLEHYRESLHD